jgi:4-amino-4-deoxy-L-arabinose transferase-like glycosyltransferase
MLDSSPPRTGSGPLPPQPAAPRALGARWEALALAGACLVFVVLASLEALRMTYPFFDDIEYLVLGQEVRALGGPVGLLRALLGGTFAESNRHPLYLAFLSLVARPDPAYHRDAQALTVAFGVVALLSCWWTARRHFGRAPAAVLALLLATGRTFVACASRPWCEPLLVALWAQALGSILDGLDARRSRSLRPWLLAGSWSGLAYLTKGTGLFLPVSLALTFLVVERARAVVDRRAWAYGAGFVVAASPLFVRNWRMFGSPIHNQNLDTLWMNRLPDFAELFAPQARALLPHGFTEYVHQLTAGALVERIAVGLGETTFLLAESMAPVGGAPGGALHVASVLAGAFATVVALRVVARSFHGSARTFLFLHAGWTYLFLFVFSVNGGNTRYFLPLAATVLAPALAARLVEDLRAAGSPRRSRWTLRMAAVVGSGVFAALALPPAALRAPGMDEVRDWLVQRLRPGDAYAVDSRTHLQPRWLAPQARQLIVSASWKEKPVDTTMLLDHLRHERVRYVVLDGASAAHMASSAEPAGRRYLFYDLLPLEPDGSLPLHGFPGGLTPVYIDPGTPRRWMVLETPWARAGAGARADRASGGGARP